MRAISDVTPVFGTSCGAGTPGESPPGAYDRRMGELDAGWVVADAWVLAAVAVYGRPCSLVELIGAADVIKHAILREDEVEAALGKFTGAGLLRVYEGWTFELTDDGTSLWSGGERDLARHLPTMLEQLSDFEPGKSPVTLPRGDMDQAVQAYLRVSGTA